TRADDDDIAALISANRVGAHRRLSCWARRATVLRQSGHLVTIPVEGCTGQHGTLLPPDLPPARRFLSQVGVPCSRPTTRTPTRPGPTRPRWRAHRRHPHGRARPGLGRHHQAEGAGDHPVIELRPGTRLRSANSTTEVIVTMGAHGELTCGGELMVPAGNADAASAP